MAVVIGMCRCRFPNNRSRTFCLLVFHLAKRIVKRRRLAEMFLPKLFRHFNRLIMSKKVSLSLKREALKLVHSSESLSAVSTQFHICTEELQTWRLVYEKEGGKGLAAYPRNICTDAIKSRIICSYRQKRTFVHP